VLVVALDLNTVACGLKHCPLSPAYHTAKKNVSHFLRSSCCRNNFGGIHRWLQILVEDQSHIEPLGNLRHRSFLGDKLVAEQCSLSLSLGVERLPVDFRE